MLLESFPCRLALVKGITVFLTGKSLLWPGARLLCFLRVIVFFSVHTATLKKIKVYLTNFEPNAFVGIK